MNQYLRLTTPVGTDQGSMEEARNRYRANTRRCDRIFQFLIKAAVGGLFAMRQQRSHASSLAFFGV